MKSQYKNNFLKDGLCNIDSLCNAIYSSFLGIKSITTLFTDLRGNKFCLTFGQLSKKNMIRITTKFQWHCNQTWNISSRRQHANMTLFLQPCGRFSLFSCVCVCAFALASFSELCCLHKQRAWSIMFDRLSTLYRLTSTNVWFFAAPQDFNWDIFYYYRWLYWWSTGCKKEHILEYLSHHKVHLSCITVCTSHFWPDFVFSFYYISIWGS